MTKQSFRVTNCNSRERSKCVWDGNCIVITPCSNVFVYLSLCVVYVQNSCKNAPILIQFTPFRRQLHNGFSKHTQHVCGLSTLHFCICNTHYLAHAVVRGDAKKKWAPQSPPTNSRNVSRHSRRSQYSSFSALYNIYIYIVLHV